MSANGSRSDAPTAVLGTIRLVRDVEAWVRGLEGDWRARVKTLRDHGAEPQAKLMDQLIEELLEAACRSKEEVLTLAQAAAESGYTVAHLGRLIRSRRIRNAGKKGKPMICRGDLPRAPKVAVVAPRGELHRTSRQQVVRSSIKGD